MGPGQVQGFLGALVGRGATKGVFVTTSYLAEAAQRVAGGPLPQKIVLIDGERLAELLVKHGIGVRTERTVELKRIDLDYFVEADADGGAIAAS